MALQKYTERLMSHPQPLFPTANDSTAFGLTTVDLWRHLFKHWPTITVCLVLVAVPTWVALYLQPAVYESSAKVWVQPDLEGTPSFLSGIAAYRESQIPEQAGRKIETEIQL